MTNEQPHAGNASHDALNWQAIQELLARKTHSAESAGAIDVLPASPSCGQAADLSIRKLHESHESVAVGACVFQGSTTGNSTLPTDEGLEH
jgi:hypothetical protein